ncbi:MAG: hypothetical protein AAFV45_05480 [Pseudomonadota bacterium]
MLKPLFFNTIISSALVCALGVSPTIGKVLPEPTEVLPVVLTLDTKLSGCGIQADYQTGQNKISIIVVGLRDETATRFSLKATWTDLTQPDRGLEDVVLKTGTLDTKVLFPTVRKLAQGTVETSAQLDGIQGARFIQSIMVAGANITLRDDAGKPLTLSLPGPVPNLVRASYLNCSGDLFRPVGESRGATP